jgi:excisionase family DNA binding protein
MINIASEKLMTLEKAAEKLLVSKSIVVKWIKYGSKGVKLEAIKFGKHWRTSEEALQRFGERMTPSQQSQPPTITPTQWHRRAEAANAALEVMLGVRRCESCKKELNTYKRTIPKKEKLWCAQCLVKEPNATMALRLRTFRWDANITQEELAKKAGMHVHLIRDFEMNRKIPSDVELAKLIEVLGNGFLSGMDRAAIEPIKCNS